MEQLTGELTDFVFQVASGNLTHNEKNDYRSIAIFKTGLRCSLESKRISAA